MMIVLDYVKILKMAVNEETETFYALLEKAKEKTFEGKETILEHFYNIDIKENGTYIHLMYNNQKMFKMPWDEFYINTRALVIDWKKEEIVLYPFDKFFELDEHKSSTQKEVYRKMNEATLVEVTEKIDGSLIVARYIDGEIFVVSSGSIQGPHVDIAKRILKTDISLQNMMQLHPNHTFMLEMKNAEIPQLIKYGIDQLTIIGMRNMQDYRLLSRQEIHVLAQQFGARVAPLFELTVEEMLEIMEDPNTTNNEGYILRIDGFLVKMKTKNFILANRFAGDPARNFNMVIQCINEGRTNAVRPMVKQDYMEAFDRFVNLISDYAQTKKVALQKMLTELPCDEEMETFVKEAQKQFFPHVKDLIALKNNRYQMLSKQDLKRLKPLAEFFTCVAHYKYAEHQGVPVEDLEKDIESGKISYIKRYEDTVNNRFVYILPKWQWLTKDLLPEGVN